jgi:glycosyltransferase involved in cell wall biosynthesis
LVNLVFITRDDPLLSNHGSEIFVGELAAELAKNGVVVNIIHGFEGSHDALPKSENVNFHSLRLIRIPYLSAIDYRRKCAVRCVKLLESKVDAVVAFGAGTFPSYIFNKIRKKLNSDTSLVFYAIDSMKMEFERAKCSSEVNTWYSKLKRWLWYYALIKSDKASCLTSDLVVASSMDTISHLTADYGVPSDKIKLLYLGIPSDYNVGFDVEDPAVPTFLHIGGFPRKGTDYFLKAMRLLEDKYGLRAKAVIVRVSQSNIDQARKLGIEVEAYKRLSIPELKPKYASCTAFVSPSLSEGFCLPVIAAESFGKPCVVTNVGSLPELVTDGGNGFIVPVADFNVLAERLYQIAINSELRRKMGENARRRSADFTLNQTASSLLTLIEKHHLESF